MTTIVAIATVLISLGGFLDFLLGPSGNRSVKERLVNFYVSIEEGDWSLLYRRPASALLEFISTLLGSRILNIVFAIRTVIISLRMTTLMLTAYLIIVYMQAAWHQTDNCPAPPPSMAFLEVPVYLAHILLQVFIVNAVFDIATWSGTICRLRVISVTRGTFTALFMIIISIILSLILIHILSAIYLSLSLAEETADYVGYIFSIKDYLQFFRNQFLQNPFHEELSFRNFITVGCYLPPARPFSICLIGLTQYAALEALLPVILFVATCLLGTVAYVTRRFTRKPISLIVERLASANNVCLTIASLLSGIVAILKILAGSIR